MRRLSSTTLNLILIVSILAACQPSLAAPTSTTEAGVTPAAAEITPTPAIEAPTAPSTGDLINAALEDGELDSTTALKYKLYAQFKDARLPAEYQGSPDQGTDSHVLDELVAVFNTLSAEDQAALMPFLMPPAYEGSWADLAQNATGTSPQAVAYSSVATAEPIKTIDCKTINKLAWNYKSAGSIPVRFWWRADRSQDEAVVNNFIAAMNTDIWSKITKVMGREPLSDEDTACYAGSGELDVYVTPEIARSYAAQSAPPGCKNTPSYIVLNPAVSNDVLAHEFMHVIQWTVNTRHDCMYPGEYAWLAEATAEWAMDYVYPTSNEEMGTTSWFYQGGTGSLAPRLDLRNDKHEYGAYLFFFYLTHHFNNNGIVKTAWDNTTSMKSLEAVDKAVPGGIKSIWADFAVANWIEPPNDQYKKWDSLTIKPSASSLVKGKLKPGAWNSTQEIDHLSIKYEWYTFSDDARLITYINGWNYDIKEEAVNTYMGVVPINDGTQQLKFTPKEPLKGIKIQAYFKVAGDSKWQLEDWTDKPYMSFCRDAASERLTDLVIITSDSELPSSSSSGYSVRYQENPPRIEVSSIGCYQYKGTASMIFTATGENGTLVDEQVVQDVIFERTDKHPNIPYPILTFNVKDGQWTRTTTYNGKECKGNGQNKASLFGTSITGYSNHLYLLYGATSGRSVTRYSGSGDISKSINATFVCPENTGVGTIQSLPWFGVDLLSVMNNLVFRWANDGSLQGSGDLLQDANNGSMKFRWDLSPQKETVKSAESSIATLAAQATQSAGGGGSKSTPQPTAVPSLPGVPNYPNASDVALINGMLIASTSDTLQVVVDFYKSEMVNQGWTDVSTPPSGAGSENSVMLMFMKGSAVATLQLAGDDEGTQIVISEFSQ